MEGTWSAGNRYSRSIREKWDTARIVRKPFYAQLLAFVLASLTTSIGSLVDGVIIGQCLGVESQAAFGIVSPLLIAFAVISAIISAGARNRFTKLVGFGRLDEARAVFSLACMLSVGFATVLMLLVLALATPITAMLGASANAANLLPKARAYLIGITFGLPAMNAMRLLNGFMGLDSDRRLVIISSLVLTVTNIVMDLLFVFLLHGDTLEMGLATSISYYAGTAVLLLHFRRKNNLLRFSLRGLPWRETGGIIRQGLPNGVCRLSNTLRTACLNRILGLVAASAAIAAYSVHRQTDSFFNPLTLGIADVVAVMAGVFVGEEDRSMLRRLLGTSFMPTVLLTLGVSAGGWFLAPQFASLFIKNDPEALELSIRAVRCYMLGMPLYGLNVSYVNYIQGIGKATLASVTGFLLEGACLVLSALALVPLAGADAVWLAFPVTQVVMLIYNLAVIAVMRRKLGLRSGFLDAMLLLPASFDVPAEDQLDYSITSMEEVNALSVAVGDFCAQHGCDPRRRYLMSLSVEEMAGNVIQHGFVDGKPHSVDVRVLKKGEDYLLRIRDDCLIFDPTNQVQLFSDSDPAHHIGLRMILGMARDIRYTCVMKLNNLLVRI